MLRTVTAVAALCLLLPSTASAGMRASVSFPSEPPVLNSAQAIAALNAQRAANGMRPLVEDSRLSQGCFNHTNAYVQKRGQFPHDEVPGQPGYSEVGDEAAQLSDLGGGGGMWGVRRNPWSGAPLHLYSLFSPYVTNVWYGESQDVKAQSRSTCMGTGVTITQHEPRPTVTTFTSMSYPADGSTGVVPNYSSGEDPFTPAEALGITTDPAGPTIVLYPDETSEQRIDLVSATLQGPDGPVSVKVASPDTPAPAPMRPGWEHWTNVSIGYFAVIERPLKPNTSYQLEVSWQLSNPEHPEIPPTSQPQTVRFTTGPKQTYPSCPPEVCLTGEFGFQTSATRLNITLSPALSGSQRVDVTITRGKGQCAKKRKGRCPKKNRWMLGYKRVNRSLLLHGGHGSMTLPRKEKGLNALWVSVRMREGFSARDRYWLPAAVSEYDYNAR